MVTASIPEWNLRTWPCVYSVSAQAYSVAAAHAELSGTNRKERKRHWARGYAAERKGQCDLLRDLAGNPFRPLTADPRWRTGAAVGHDRTMYESRDFGAMPVLADALEEAGCNDTGVLAHCRGDEPHVRDCWVLDLVLGKE